MNFKYTIGVKGSNSLVRLLEIVMFVLLMIHFFVNQVVLGYHEKFI